jgi:hypothetical protein
MESRTKYKNQLNMMNDNKILPRLSNTVSVMLHLFITFQLSFDCIDKHIA